MPCHVERRGAHAGREPVAAGRGPPHLDAAGEHADADWLLSLSAWQQDDQLSVESAGPFRRPLKLSPDELWTLDLALALDPKGDQVCQKFAAVRPKGVAAPDSPSMALSSAGQELHGLLVLATEQHRSLDLRYAGEGELVPTRWVIQPHQLVEHRGRTYVVAWCEQTRDWRHFRSDRMLEGTLGDGTFKPRADFQPVTHPGDLFRAPAEQVVEVRVRFSAASAPWVRERYPVHQMQPDGSVVVTLRAASHAWLVRRVLEYGADAEVLSPESYRAAMRRAVA